jgi:hypothetical protein
MEEPLCPTQQITVRQETHHLPAKIDADANDDFSQDAATNRKPKSGVGLTEPVDDANEKTRHYDGQNPGRHSPSPATEKVSGAGPALAEHSKDAKAPKGGRQAGTYVQDGKTKIKEDRKVVAGKETYEVADFARKFGVSPDEAKTIIKRYGPSRKKLDTHMAARSA